MSLKVWVKFMSFVTVTALIYIHMQMQIFDLAYQGKDREGRTHELRDRSGLLTHQVLTLKSANHLGNQLLEKNSSLQFMGHDRVMTLTGPSSIVSQLPASVKGKNENFLLWNLLSFLSPQEAKAWDRQ
ncbi:MAG: hypothetical protein HY209_05205 [Candidatus Omnitrophica bacterium]|nr:hypothetical protein [Candidatus Omnitrophota bacterium]